MMKAGASRVAGSLLPALLLISSCSAPQRAPASGLALGPNACETGSRPPLAEREAQIRALRDTIERSLTQTAPNSTYKEPAPGRLFNGNFDWHSSVHAHWALLSIARLTHDAALEQRVLQRLTPAALAAEGERLAKQPQDPPNEMPYGQSWLLLLLHELESHPGGASPEAEALRHATEERVFSYLENSPFPEGKKGGLLAKDDPAYFSRAHSSWLFAYLLTKMSQPKGAAARRLARLRARIDQHRAELLRQTQNTAKDFLYLPAVLWLVDQVEPKRVSAPPQGYRGTVVDFPKLPVEGGNAHQSGAVMVSLWPYAMQASRGDRASCEKFNEWLDQMLSRPEYWRFDPGSIETFHTVGHWVPQFIWMGILLEQQK